MLNEQPRKATQSQFDAMGLNRIERESLLKTAWESGGIVPMPFSPGAGRTGPWKSSQIECAQTILVPIGMIEKSLES